MKMDKKVFRQTEKYLYDFVLDHLGCEYRFGIPPLDAEKVDGGEYISTQLRHVLANDVVLSRVYQIKRTYKNALTPLEREVCRVHYNWFAEYPEPKWENLEGIGKTLYYKTRKNIVHKMARALGLLIE
jgi:hypothetical protein